MKKNAKNAVARLTIATIVIFVATIGIAEMHISADFFPVYDGNGKWYLFPQLMRYGLYALLGLDAVLATGVISEAPKSSEGLLQKIVATMVIFVATMGIMEMHFSVEFYPVYDGDGNWHFLPQMLRYGMYVLLGTNILLAVRTAHGAWMYLVCGEKR